MALDQLLDQGLDHPHLWWDPLQWSNTETMEEFRKVITNLGTIIYDSPDLIVVADDVPAKVGAHHFCIIVKRDRWPNHW